MLEVQAHNIAPLSNLIISAVQEMTPVSAKEQGNRQYRGKTEKVSEYNQEILLRASLATNFLVGVLKLAPSDAATC